MDKIPFSFYDFFGYLACGVLLMASIDYFFVNHQLIVYAGHNVAQGVVSILLIYIIGHIIATPSAWILETVLAKRVLNHPRKNLLLTKSDLKWFKRFFNDYYRPLAPAVATKICKYFEVTDRAQLTDDNFEEIYQYIFSKVKRDESSLGRLNIFLNLYGFTRSISLTCFILTLILLINSVITNNWCNVYWIIGFLLTGLILLYRFLKFYRYYTYDMYLSFLSLIEKKDVDKS